MEHLFLYVWILSRSTVILRLIHVVACESIQSFLRLSSTPLRIYTGNLFIRSPINRHLDCFQFLVLTNKTALNFCVSLCVDFYFYSSLANIQAWNNWILWWVCAEKYFGMLFLRGQLNYPSYQHKKQKSPVFFPCTFVVSFLFFSI